MKILYNPGKFNGGAPLSLLQYALIAKKNGNEVLAVGEFANNETKYRDLDIRVYNIPCFLMRKPLISFNSIINLLEVVKNEKPDIIHSSSYGIIPSKFVSMYLGIPIIYSIAGGKNIGKKVKQKIFVDERLIVYSEENKMDLLESGYNPGNIEVISNRMSVSEENSNSHNSSDELRALLISRLDKGLIKSIINVINVIINLSDKHANLYLDIVGSGNLIDEVKEIASNKNYELGNEVIRVRGFQENVSEYIERADIVFGKGRSIIEAILHKKVSFIIGEDHKISKCSLESIPNLYRYNFSGRNIAFETNIDEISSILEDIEFYREGNDELDNIRTKVDKLYNINHVEKKIVNLYEDGLNSIETIRRKPLAAIRFLIRTYWYGFVLRNQ